MAHKLRRPGIAGYRLGAEELYLFTCGVDRKWIEEPGQSGGAALSWLGTTLISQTCFDLLIAMT